MAQAKIEIGGTYQYKGRVYTVVAKKSFGWLVIQEQGASAPGQAKQAAFLSEAVKIETQA